MLLGPFWAEHERPNAKGIYCRTRCWAPRWVVALGLMLEKACSQLSDGGIGPDLGKFGNQFVRGTAPSASVQFVPFSSFSSVHEICRPWLLVRLRLIKLGFPWQIFRKFILHNLWICEIYIIPPYLSIKTAYWSFKVIDLTLTLNDIKKVKVHPEHVNSDFPHLE